MSDGCRGACSCVETQTEVSRDERRARRMRGGEGCGPRGLREGWNGRWVKAAAVKVSGAGRERRER